MEDDNIIPYETSPTLTVEQAVMRMLGYPGEFNFMAGTEPMVFELSEYLYDLQDEADCAFGNASVELTMLKRNENASPEAVEIAEKQVTQMPPECTSYNPLHN